ncbi:peptidoglycan-binding protein [Pelagibacterium lacus]|uniref:Peptidoglycan binding-like domain-containing protein n=1 Tax=Pelagibacterium lacus TaxID=2282655 RepID=A0A369W6N1_9HYPH|nr:peptidoglycan-binding protein [Pelagibacterium lacus]RDE08912.1 hypothetical protein DVH29_09170 [Pelagibacterium lacus]
MARTHPEHAWPEQHTVASRSDGAQWESLRNELVALLDQVEDHVALAAVPAEPVPAPAPAVPKPAPRPNRHNEALKSVRQAVTRLADRSEDERPAMRENVVDAINQIRARQGAAAAQPAPEAGPTRPTLEAVRPAAPSETQGLAQSLDRLGERIGRFESDVVARFESLDNRADISNQIGQLSDVIEMLATAVGETGHIHRIEAQIGNLAQLLAEDRAAGADATGHRIDQLATAVERLVDHQSDTTAQVAAQIMDQTVHAQERQAQSMELIERSVRSIYDRIDALEAARAEPAYVERLSQDMAALTEAVAARREPESLLDKIDALSARIEMAEAPNRAEADILAESVAALRGVIAETVAPRFDALEARIDTMPAPAESTDAAAIETQLRAISRRVEETSAQLRALAAQPQPAPIAEDFDTLARRIAEEANALAAQPADNPDGIGKADLEALESRLATLFAHTVADPGETQSHFEGVKSSIAQVDNRIARLEAMLNGRDKPAQPAQPAVSDAIPVPRRRKAPDDAMPQDPATGSARPAPAPQAPLAAPPLETVEEMVDTFIAAEAAASETGPGFAIDPETVERPAKPQSSLAAGRRDNPFEPPFRAPADDTAASPSVSNASRLSFIEAARRSARQPEIEESEPKSLIGRALARFQKSEAQPEEAADAPYPDAAVPDIETGPAPDDADYEDEDDRPGFLARNRRALLLGTALVVAIALAVPLLLDRGAPAPQQSASVIQPAAAAPEAPQSAADEELAAEPAPEMDAAALDALPAILPADVLTSAVRVIEQQPSLSAARVDASTLSGTPMLDPVQTASIAAPATSLTAPQPMTAAALPAISAPEGLEPAGLRTAAESGDRFAQFEVGAILTEGTIIEQDFTQAAAWYERSAAQGFVPAQYRLGSLYENGRGVDRDLEMARLWYQRAAEAGNRMSMHNLASLYAGGELETQDFAAAAHWFEEAAARGLTDSQFNLGMLHARGLGVEQDFEQSYVWFSLAARAGDQDAAAARDDVARSLDSATVVALDDEVTGWTPAEFDLAANFAPIGTWDQAFDPGPEITNSDVIVQVQVLLGKLGYDIGTPDGIVGPKTREAIAGFETATGMSESRAINPRLLAVLGSQPV